LVKLPTLPNLDGLIALARRDGVDVRPTLVRVLTDLYVHKRGHSLDEEHRYTELALWLLAGVDVATRVAVAKKLATYEEAPRLVVRRLARDTFEVAEPILTRSSRLASDDLLAIIKDFGPRYAAAIARRDSPDAASAESAEASNASAVAAEAATVHDAAAASVVDEAATVADDTTPVAAKPAAITRKTVPLGDYFLSADSPERRLLLANLEDGALTPSERAFAENTQDAIRELETAALGRRPDEFICGLERALRIPHHQARRIVHDETGEPLLVAMKALGMRPDMLLRILLFLNPVIGHSVERVFDLANLFDRLSAEAALHLVSSWQSQPGEQRRYQPLTWDDERPSARRVFADHPRRFPVQVPDGRSDARPWPVRSQRTS
jgi:uncharacterized protein (DUF2336 family)